MAVTLETLKAEAERRGYKVAVDAEYITIEKKRFSHVKRSLSRFPEFSLDPELAEQYALLDAYYWVRGYSLDYGDDGAFELHRGMLHPRYNPQVRVAQTFDYHWDAGWDMEVLQQKLAAWVEEVEQPRR